MSDTQSTPTTQPTQDPKVLNQENLDLTSTQTDAPVVSETETQASKPDGYYGDDTNLGSDELDLSFLDDEEKVEK